jgi:anti-anti-sigma regulatory factor
MAITCTSTALPETVVLTVKGRLDTAGALIVRQALRKAEAQAPPAVVVDVQGLRAASDRDLMVFAAAARRMPLVLCGASPTLARRLARHSVLRYLPTLADRATAITAVSKGEVTRQRWSLDVAPTAQASAVGRDLVARALLAWHLDALRADAELIISELCANVVRHAHTSMIVNVWRSQRYLHLEVRDYSTQPPRSSETGIGSCASDHGRGLDMVSAFSVAWGVLPAADGKTVWAALKLPARSPHDGFAQVGPP